MTGRGQAAVSDDSTGEPKRVLFVDNFDSFTYNLVEYVSEHAETTVVRNTATLAAVRDADPDAIVISPGPGHPRNDRDVGVTNEVLREVSPEVPDCFDVTATTTVDGEELVMGVRHREHPIECVQFHPESVLTAVGHDVIRNFLAGVE